MGYYYMLFSKVFNWFKYKTLPPSVLFSNRLFVERDSKHRRATSQLGLTFRNSKWSTYARSNINIGHQNSYFNLLAKVGGLVLALIALTSFSSYYNVKFVSEASYSVLWFVFDADLYLKMAFSSSLLCLLQALTSSIQSQLLGSSASPKAGTGSINLASEVTIPKSLHKPILRKWLTTSSSSTDVAQLFSTSTSNTGTAANLFAPLYTATHLLRQDKFSSVDLSAQLGLISDTARSCTTTPVNLDLAPSSSTPALSSAFIDYSVFGSQSNYARRTSSPEFSQWSLASVESETSLYPSTLKTATGLFYLNQTSAAALNSQAIRTPELSAVKDSADQQLSLIRWQRWLYKYNILHRALLKNSTYITQVHKLLNSGFYNDSLTTRNIWNAQYFSDEGLGSTQTRDLYNALYGNYLGQTSSPNQLAGSTANVMNSSSIFSLGYYNLSYHWFIQRFYQFNTLGNNGAYYAPVSASKPLVAVSNEAANLADRSVLFDMELSSALTSTSRDASTGLTQSSNSVSNVFLNYSDTLFFNQSRLESLKNLSSSKSTSGVTFYSPQKLNNVNVKGR